VKEINAISVNKRLSYHREINEHELSNSMRQNPSSEANSRSTNHEIPHPLWNLKVHYRVYNSPPFKLILIQLNAVHTLTYFLKYPF
jgi:hypothetical protein